MKPENFKESLLQYNVLAQSFLALPPHQVEAPLLTVDFLDLELGYNELKEAILAERTATDGERNNPKEGAIKAKKEIEPGAFAPGDLPLTSKPALQLLSSQFWTKGE